jgi:hypothetical protein
VGREAITRRAEESACAYVDWLEGCWGGRRGGG